jgi:hypothetical protein
VREARLGEARPLSRGARPRPWHRLNHEIPVVRKRRRPLLALTLNERQGVGDHAADRSIGIPSDYRGGRRSTDGTIEWCRDHGFQVYVQRRRGIRHACSRCPLIEGDLSHHQPGRHCSPEAILSCSPRLPRVRPCDCEPLIGRRPERRRHRDGLGQLAVHSHREPSSRRPVH